MNDVRIKRVTNGVLVDIGCHSFVFNDIPKACAEIQEYLIDPKGTQKRWETVIKNWYRVQGEADGPDILAPPERCEATRPRPDLSEDRAYRGGVVESPSQVNLSASGRIRG